MVHISDLDIHSLHLHELRFGFIELAMLKVWHRTAEDTVCKQQTQRMDRLISSEDIYFFRYLHVYVLAQTRLSDYGLSKKGAMGLNVISNRTST